ncbi:MAG: hypothetical protein E7473_05605 [Ruminococcaceae bacterium]|nr:hypothetical protein [Oscillospiraceae bacterium]
MSEILTKGVAYHGNRMLTHVREDMQDIAASGFNAVLHMFSHNDWDRHKNIMKEIFEITSYYGLDNWVDNWGLGGPPGDKSHFLSYHPEAHQVLSNGKISPVHVCFNSQAYVDFTKSWIDTVYDAGAKKIFWDEPHMRDFNENGERIWTCRCETCQKLFEERYNMPMPTLFTKEVDEFRKWTITNYFQTVASYAKEKGMYNSICVMFNDTQNNTNFGVDLDSICSTPALDNIGSDPYWIEPSATFAKDYEDVYKFVYEKTKWNLDVCKKFNKDHNIWLQTYSNPVGTEEEIIAAADAIYDCGARTIFAWGYRGSDANDYRSKAPDRTWYTTKAAFERISERHRNALRDATMKKLGLK